MFWRIVNPPTRPLAGWAPWWVLLETTGRRTGEPRTTPLARGPLDGDVLWLASVHGRKAAWVRNIEARPEVRIKLSGRWYPARAIVHEFDQTIAQRFNAYARSGPRALGIEPVLIRVELKLIERSPD
jgi:deazaflavin-dependent oxidoreductase (nitroreductase family)